MLHNNDFSIKLDNTTDLTNIKKPNVCEGVRYAYVALMEYNVSIISIWCYYISKLKVHIYSQLHLLT